MCDESRTTASAAAVACQSFTVTKEQTLPHPGERKTIFVASGEF